MIKYSHHSFSTSAIEESGVGDPHEHHSFLLSQSIITVYEQGLCCGQSDRFELVFNCFCVSYVLFLLEVIVVLVPHCRSKRIMIHVNLHGQSSLFRCRSGEPHSSSNKQKTEKEVC